MTDAVTHKITDQALHWKPGQLDGVSLMRAEFQRFVFARHSHDTFALGVIEKGAQRFRHGGATHTAPTGAIITVNPDEVHDGETAAPDGYQYRMAYIEADRIREILSGIYGDGACLQFFPQPVTRDHELAAKLRSALLCLESGRSSGALESQSLFYQTVGELFQHHGRRRQTPAVLSENRGAVDRAIEFIRENALADLSLEEIAAAAGLSRFHFLRLFRKSTGLPPHAYLIQRRVEIARRAIEKGASLSRAAMEAGFSDQSHLTRRFKAIYGIPPGRYRRTILS